MQQIREYNIGDVVKISANNYENYNGVGFTSEMKEYIGRIATIKDKRRSFCDGYVYSIDIDEGWWSWSATFFEDVSMINIEDITLN